jgi:hypothetical protein
LLSQNPENSQITRLTTEKNLTEVQFGVSNAGEVVMVLVLVVMMVVVIMIMMIQIPTTFYSG